MTEEQLAQLQALYEKYTKLHEEAVTSKDAHSTIDALKITCRGLKRAVDLGVEGLPKVTFWVNHVISETQDHNTALLGTNLRLLVSLALDIEQAVGLSLLRLIIDLRQEEWDNHRGKASQTGYRLVQTHILHHGYDCIPHIENTITKFSKPNPSSLYEQKEYPIIVNTVQALLPRVKVACGVAD